MPRNENQEATDLAQIASRYKMSKLTFQEMIEVREKMASDKPPPFSTNTQEATRKDILDISVNCHEGFNDKCLKDFEIKNFWRHKVFAVGNSSPSNWRKPILEYLENPVRDTDRKIKYKALSYVLLGNVIEENSIGNIA